MNSEQSSNNPKLGKFIYLIHLFIFQYFIDGKIDLESLSDEQLNRMVVMLPIVFPHSMIPIRLPELYYNIKNKIYPDYLHYALVALGSAASKKMGTLKENEQELAFIKKSTDLINSKADIRNPYYLWACVLILQYCTTIVNTPIHETALMSAKHSVRVSKIYQLDLSKITKLRYSEEELEFRRRVFWTFYAFDRGSSLFSGSFSTIEDRDIVLDLPKNDFWWRYGGECKVKHPEILLWNIIANGENSEQYSKEDIKNFVKTRTLSGKIGVFAKRRWLKKVYNPDDDDFQFVLLIDNTNKFDENIVKNLPTDLSLIKEAYSKYKDTIRFTVDIEHILYKYTFAQFHFYMKNTLYQTEMVRVEGIQIDPKRIVSAKNICIDTAKKQIDLMYQLSSALPPEYWKTTSITTEFKSAIPVIFLMYLNRLSNFINESHKENEKSKALFESMKKYSIDESDVHPWLVPKYGSLFFLTCCFGGSFSAMKITDYLYIKDNFATFVNQYQKEESSNDSNIEPTRNPNTFAIQSEEVPEEPGLSRNKSNESSYKSNYEQYIKYNNLLEKSSPNSTENYYYQYMVDILTERVLQDIISNPANDHNNFELQSIFPTISFDKLFSKVDSKENENTEQYDMTELDLMFWS
ncbi:hypothetical protein BB558_000512 [Smittium angustum]|uniref:Xylanolytic transcriptional activator regulatory domain-containing protein n=1 Tax=Smittium angustum TaxID=133377 RepID=A0A2U1JE09_SMIAN|nr:hypothetical protein BB558_000512 [Smittium angustum]